MGSVGSTATGGGDVINEVGTIPTARRHANDEARTLLDLAPPPASVVASVLLVRPGSLNPRHPVLMDRRRHQWWRTDGASAPGER
jgi:hypothetical protein